MAITTTRARAFAAGAAALTLTIGVLAACSAGSPGSADQGDGSTITMTSWYDDAGIGPALEAANAQLKSEGIVLEHSSIPFDQYNNYLSTQLASGEGPDIVVDGASFPARIKAGNLQAITDEQFVSEFNEAGLALTTSQDDEVYGIPTYGWFSGIFYNKDLFEQQGLQVPATFDEFVAVSKQFLDAGIQPLAIGLGEGGDKAWHSLNGYLENAFYHGAGDPEVDTALAFDEGDLGGNWDEPVETWYQLVEEGIITPTMLGVPDAQAISTFAAGDAAMTITGPWDYSKFQEAGLDFGIFPHIGEDPDDRWLIGGPGANLGINANSGNPDAARKVLEVLATPDVQQALVDANPGAFSYRSGVSADMPAEYELVADTLAAGNVGLPADRWGVNMPAQAMVDTGITGLQKLIGGQVDPDGFIAELDAQADSVRY